MSSLRDAARRRQELNPLTTSLNVLQQQQQQQQQQHSVHQTPSSALSVTSLSAPFGYNPQVYTPASAVREYNPQQWTNSPSQASEHSAHFRTRSTQDSEVVVPAPPPYSPPRSNRASMILSDDPSSAISPATRSSPAFRASPEPASNPVFPPPPGPGTRTRAVSSDRPHTIFNISSPFSRRNTPESSRLPTESNNENTQRRPVPITIHPSEQTADDVDQLQFESRPPASRRAVSAGATSTPSSSRSRGSSTTRWEPGMPLPPPPPGPPPPTSRSQSMTRPTDRVTAPPTRRNLAPLSNLGPVPPTPAGWVDEDVAGRGRSPNRGLTIDTSSITSSMNSSTAADSTSGSSSSGLARSRATRGEPKSIRERRSESRTGKSVAVEEPSNNPWAEAITPSDIVVPLTGLTRRPTITKSTPRSAGSRRTETPKSSDMSHLTTPIHTASTTSGSRGSTPRPLNSSHRPEAPTPPFSPNQIRSAFLDGSPAIPPKALPTPPPQSKLTAGSPSRPISHILHMPNNDVAIPAPLTPSRPTSRQSNGSQMSLKSPSDHFARAAIERHRVFVEKEAAATSDSERVRLFADFIVMESRLRRDRYADAIDVMGSEILELTRDLFRPYNSPRRESTTSRSSGWTPESSTGPRSHRGSLVGALQENLQTSSTPNSATGPMSPGLARPESNWWTGYMPSLSPIPSMSVSEALDESDSRGRPSSRWWEISQEGSTGTPSMRLEQRSKRESKYMGMPKELREALQYENGDRQSESSTGGPSHASYAADEYPPEKVGWHEQDVSSPPAQTPGNCVSPFSQTPFTPNPNHLDVSRLVTLPPPFPRHHPAVNNNHPDLTSIRTVVRVLSDFTEVEATKERYNTTNAQIEEENATAASKRRNSLRVNIQREIQSGNMTYNDAAKLEAASAVSEAEKAKEASKKSFELFQSQVVMPLNDLLMERVARATDLFTQLRSQLFVDAQQQSPNLTQEEGDEQPELLEKLTLLKWIFEAREQLHRELFDLLSDRNDRYRDMVIQPYSLAGNQAKVDSAKDFFAEDAGKRKLAFEQEILKRSEEFMDVIEENVVRGVEVQLSAFWDIAPNLRRITDKVPQDLNGFNIQIPASELDENPSYHDFPMQYLYSLVEHSEKSTYQFIESQINLLCLLHEVKSGVTLANCRLMETQRIMQGESLEDVKGELKEVERDEERRLTDDLKEKVSCIEELWGEALGRSIEGIRTRIRAFLMQRGGWIDEE